MRRLPWRWCLLFVTASVAVSTTLASVALVVLHRQLFPEAGLKSFLHMAWRSTTMGLWCLLAALTLVAFLVFARRQGRTSLRDELADKPWWVPVVVALLAIFVVAPAIMTVFMMGFAQVVRLGEVSSPPGKVRVQNDLGTTVSITFCPKQSCGNQTSRRMHDGDYVDYPAGRSPKIPDSVVIQERDGTFRCGTLDHSAPLSLAEDTDAGDCGADVDSMDGH